MRTLPYTVVAGLCLTSCALSSGVVPVGPDTYVLTEMRAPVRGGGAEAERVVLASASEFCRLRGREIVLLDVRPDGDPRTIYWPTAFDATFQCRLPGSAASRPATMPAAPG